MPTRISSIFPFLLITLLCVSGVELFYLAVEHYLLDTAKRGTPVTTRVADSSGTTSEKTKNVDYSIITERNLFGPSPDGKKTTETDSEPANEELESTTLDIVLMGTIGGEEQGSRAIILNKSDRKQELYKEGDTVQGALIKDIQRGKVILNIDDRDEMLDMSESGQYAQSASQSTPVRPGGIRKNIMTSPLQRIEVSEADRASKPRVVRPTRRIVRPRSAAASEDVASEAVPVTEELPPELQDQDVEPQENPEQENEQQAVEQQ